MVERSDEYIIGRLIERSRLLIALSDEIPVETKLQTQPLLKQLEQAFPEEVHGGVVEILLARHAGSVPHSRRHGQGTGAPAAPGLSSNPYRCTDARGQPGGEGSFDIRIASPPRRGG